MKLYYIEVYLKTYTEREIYKQKIGAYYTRANTPQKAENNIRYKHYFYDNMDYGYEEIYVFKITEITPHN